MTTTTDALTTNGKKEEKPRTAKRPVQIHDETWVLLVELREQLKLSNDEAVRAGLLALKGKVGSMKVETKEEKLLRLATGVVDA